MLHVFRESIGRYVAIAILALIAITFIFFGIDFSITRSSFAAKVNGESIPILEFERELQLALNQYLQLYRVELTDDLRRELRRQVLDEMIMREVLTQQAKDAGYRVSNERLVEDIRSATVFQVGGQFSADVYRSLLAAEGLTPTGFEAQQRDQASLRELQDGMFESAFITPAEFRRNIELYYQQRQIAYAVFAAEDFLADVQIPDEDLAAYHAENSSRFMTEETVDIEFIELSLDDVAATVDVSEEQLRESYDAQAELYAGNEERRVSHILIEIIGDDTTDADVRIADVMERLDAGEDFATLAAEVSDDIGTRNAGGDLGLITRGMLSGPFEDALFEMQVGDIRGPVETEFGYHVLRLEEIRAGEMASFESVRDQIRDELAGSEAYSEFLARVREIDDVAFNAVDNLTSVAAEFDLPLETIEGLTVSGGADRFPDPAPIIAAAFDPDAIVTGENSDLIELGPESVAVLRVAAHYPPAPKPFEEVTDEIRDILAREAAEDLAADAATAFFDELDVDAVAAGTQDPAALAATHGGNWSETRWVDRSAATVPSAVLSLVYAQARPAADRASVFRTPVGNGDSAIVLLFAVAPGNPDDIPSADREQGRLQLIDEHARIEINAYAGDTRQRASVRVPDEVLDPDF